MRFRGADHAAEVLENRLTDLSVGSRSLADDHAMLERISRHNSPRQGLTVQGPCKSLHGALQATIRHAAKGLVDACEYSPIDVGPILHRAAAATWAAEARERLSTEAA